MARPRKQNRHLPKYVTVVHGSYWYRPPSKEHHQKVCRVGDEATLYRFLADKLEPVKNEDLKTLNDCFKRYEQEVVPTLKERTQRDYRRHLRVLREAFGDRRINDLKPRDIGRFLDVQSGKIHRNRQVAVLSAVFSKAVGRWYVADANPCRDVERNPSRKRDRYVTNDEYATVYGAMPARVQIAMDLALLTGQRQGDILTLRWDQVSDEGIKFRQSKTGKRLLVEMSPALKAVLERARDMVPQLPREYVVKRRDGKAYTSEGFRTIWQKHMRRLHQGWTRRYKGGRTVVYEPKLAQRFTFHDLRAKSVSDAGSIQEAFERAGHQSMAMTRGVYDRGERKVKPLR